MRRPIRPCWAALASLLVFAVLASAMNLLVYGTPTSSNTGPLWGVTRFIARHLEPLAGEDLPQILLWVAPDVPGFLAGLGTWTVLRRRREDEFLHCRKCDHILHGLTAPRCPECGTPI